PPFLGGDRLQIDARRAAFHDLTLASDRMDLLAALLAAMREGYRAAFAALDWESPPPSRIVLTGGGHETLRRLLREWGAGNGETIDEAAMRGVARLFDA